MNGINPGHLKRYVVVPTLALIGQGGEVAVNLVVGTALAETGAGYLRQLGSGPALGLWQMEPATHEDLWARFLSSSKYHDLAKKIDEMTSTDISRQEQLIANLRYACAMTRVKYLSLPVALPKNYSREFAQYHKRYYNTSAGKANAGINEALFQLAIDA